MLTLQDANDIELKLSETLTTAALALIGVVMATINKQLTGTAKIVYGILIILSVCIFVFSIFFGIIHFLILHRYLSKAAETSGIIVNQLDSAQKQTDTNAVRNVWLPILKKQCGNDSPKWALYLQLACFMVSIILLIACTVYVLYC